MTAEHLFPRQVKNFLKCHLFYLGASRKFNIILLKKRGTLNQSNPKTKHHEKNIERKTI